MLFREGVIFSCALNLLKYVLFYSYHTYSASRKYALFTLECFCKRLLVQWNFYAIWVLFLLLKSSSILLCQTFFCISVISEKNCFCISPLFVIFLLLLMLLSFQLKCFICCYLVKKSCLVFFYSKANFKFLADQKSLDVTLN